MKCSQEWVVRCVTVLYITELYLLFYILFFFFFFFEENMVGTNEGPFFEQYLNINIYLYELCNVSVL